MVSTSKILTVSYGTFSCTLEGFDDSFDTMKAIAEYFRDLAADDRYFGAEPPTPDAEMLARIAEREIARRVDAHEQEGNIVLRAAEGATLSAPVETPADQATDETKEDATAEDEVSPEITAEETPKAEHTPEIEGDQSVDMPQSEDDATTQEAAAEEVEVPATAEPAEAESEPAIADIMAQADVDASVEADTAKEPEQEPAVAEQAVAEDVDAGDTPEAETATIAESMEDNADEASEPAEAEAAEDGDSVADRLRRIRSLVDGSEAGFQDTVYSEDEHAQDFLSETAADLDDVLSVDDAVDVAAQDEADEPDLSSVLGEAQVEAPEQEPEETSEPEAVEKVAEAEPVELAEDTLAQLLADAMPEEAIEAETDTPDAEAAPAEVAVERPVVQARVVKMKRSEFEAAISEGYIEEDDDESVDDNLFGDDSGLSAEEEADLQRELAEVEAEFGAPEVEDAPEPEVAAASEEAPEVDEDESGPLRLTEADQVEDEAEVAAPEATDRAEPEADNVEDEQSARGISKLQRAERQADLARIFDEADTQLDAPESNKRRSAIQHLRAAVAATRAEKKAGATLKEDVDDSPYRSDLASVVRPRRPEPEKGRPRADRPSAAPSAPAPLKLVAEQRVDVQSEPVRPRRVSAAVLEEPAAAVSADAVDSNFSEFAEEMGARGLPELLEAAAAYMADVEGRAQFSRPMLMGKLKEVEGRDFSREDGLRTFGQLLRQGKLQKLKGGRFCVTDNTDFRAETRNAG